MDFPAPYGGYSLLARLGHGGMAEIFLARKAGPGGFAKLVVIKRILPHLSRQKEMVEMFLDEARLAARLEHPNIVQVFDMGEAEGSFFIAMEYLAGQSLAAIVKAARDADRPLTPAFGARVVAEACQGLHYAHEFSEDDGASLGIVHRDVSPQNLFVTYDGRVKVLDFGVAKVTSKIAHTRTGTVKGKLSYMSPEQCRGELLDRRSDVFALGIVLFESISGIRLFKFEDEFSALTKIGTGNFRRPRELAPEAPPALLAIAERALAVKAQDRFESARQMGLELDGYLRSSGAPTSPEDLAASMKELFGTDIALRKQLIKETDDRAMIFRQLTDDSFDSMPGVTAPTHSVMPAAPPSTHSRARTSRRWVGVGALIALGVSGALWLGRRAPVTPAAPPASIDLLVGDFQNATADPLFDGTLEPIFTIALEGAPFINAYKRSDAKRVAARLKPDAGTLDESTARLVATSEGLSVVTSGALVRRGNEYGLSVRVIDALNGKSITEREVGASSKQDVLPRLEQLAAQIRNALGDSTPQSVQLAALETFSANSLEAAHEYALAQELLTGAHPVDALSHYQRAIDVDPGFGRAYAGLSTAYLHLHQLEKGKQAMDMAFSHMDRMTPRERLRTRGAYYLMTRNDEKAIEAYEELIRQYPSDFAASVGLPVAYCYRRDMTRALKTGQRAVGLRPSDMVAATNVPIYAMYNSDFEFAAREARRLAGINSQYPTVQVTWGVSELALGRRDAALEAWRSCALAGAYGRSLAADGLADLALYSGRTSEAIKILDTAIPEDLASNPSAGAAKLVTLAAVRLSLGQKPVALQVLDRALAASRSESVLFAAARTYLDAGEEEKARALAAEMGSKVTPEPQAYAKLIEGERLLRRGLPSEAVRSFKESKQILDTWLAHVDLGRAYLDASAFVEADAELEQAVRRRGEAAALFIDEVPTYHLFPPVLYWRARAQEGLKSPGAQDSFRAFLEIKRNSETDAMVEDARRRTAALAVTPATVR